MSQLPDNERDLEAERAFEWSREFTPDHPDRGDRSKLDIPPYLEAATDRFKERRAAALRQFDAEMAEAIAEREERIAELDRTYPPRPGRSVVEVVRDPRYDQEIKLLDLEARTKKDAIKLTARMEMHAADEEYETTVRREGKAIRDEYERHLADLEARAFSEPSDLPVAGPDVTVG